MVYNGTLVPLLILALALLPLLLTVPVVVVVGVGDVLLYGVGDWVSLVNSLYGESEFEVL